MLLTIAEKIVNGYFAALPRSKPQHHQAEQAHLIAHRGAHNNKQGLIENTMAAFARAEEAGCWGIEFDIRATADQVLVVIHDDNLNRLWGHNAAIADLHFAELRAMEPGVPTLAEVIARFSKTMHFFIELKEPFHDEQALIACLQPLTPCQDYHLLALDPAIFRSLTQCTKAAMLLVSVHNNTNAFCNISAAEGFGGVMGSYFFLNQKHINQLQSVNQLYGVGFVDSKYSLYRELNRGINWLFTNQAVAVSDDLKQMQRKAVSA